MACALRGKKMGGGFVAGSSDPLIGSGCQWVSRGVGVELVVDLAVCGERSGASGWEKCCDHKQLRIAGIDMWVRWEVRWGVAHRSVESSRARVDALGAWWRILSL
jgi:hypothetical protein